jgi:hypothetical protein
MSPGAQLASAALASGIALAAHGGKMALRATVTPSPEPVSNIGLSLAEDAAAIGLTWFATRHPYLAAAVALAMVVVVLLVIRAVWRAMRRWLAAAKGQWRRFGFGSGAAS